MSERKDDGGCAFPMPGSSTGMRLRDWFAGQALVGILSTETAVAEIMVQVMASGDTLHRRTASMAYAFADAMIAERSK